jgi:ubiquinone/menaquinone biosynthesis C-methylase UbiE
VGMFRWMAPLFGRYGDRWDDADIAKVGGWISPYLGENRTLLDLGGGTGALAARLSDALDVTVTLLDPSPEMIAQMKPHPRVRAVVGVAEAMPFAHASFDACLISDAFHHVRDQDGAVREISRVVRPGGGLLVLDFDSRGLMRLIVWGEKLLGEPGAFFTPDGMCAYMAERGIDGHCEMTRGASYYFLGAIPNPPAAAAGAEPTAAP